MVRSATTHDFEGLERFCEPGHSVLDTPFCLGGWLIATNGSILVALKTELPNDPGATTKMKRKILETITYATRDLASSQLELWPSHITVHDVNKVLCKGEYSPQCVTELCGTRVQSRYLFMLQTLSPNGCCESKGALLVGIPGGIAAVMQIAPKDANETAFVDRN